MPEIKPDLSDPNRCVSVHWNLPVQCVLPSSHRENWHEAWHPQTSNRIRYRRSMGGYATEELNDGWRDLQIPPPGGHCNDQHSSYPNVRCAQAYGHGWYHTATVDGCRYSWNTPVPKGLDAYQLASDVKQLRGLVVQLTSELARVETEIQAAIDRSRDHERELGTSEPAMTARRLGLLAALRIVQDGRPSVITPVEPLHAAPQARKGVA